MCATLDPFLSLTLINPSRGTRAAILGEAGDEQLQRQTDDMMMGFDTDPAGSPAATAAASGVVDSNSGGGMGGHRSNVGAADRGGDSGSRRADRIARRQAQARVAGESAAGPGGWPLHMPN